MDSISVRWALNPTVLWFHFDTILAAEGIYKYPFGISTAKAPEEYWGLLTLEGQAVVNRLCHNIKLSLRQEICVRRDYFSLVVPKERHWPKALPLVIASIREAMDQPNMSVKPCTSWGVQTFGEPPQWLRELLEHVA